jgi:predicted signal transduction protein with EAL and GGDEF domain
LCHVANRLRRTLRNGEFGARFGGDEFAVLQQDVADDAAVEALARRIGEAIAEPYRVNDAVAQVTASTGIARSSPGLVDADTILMRADRALYRAKEDGRNRFCLYSDELDRQLRERVQLGEELRNAISRGELELHYQPQVELATGRILGLEALLRWRHPSRGLLAPAAFLPIAERNGSIIEIGRWVFDDACRQYRAWDDAGIAPRVLAVNVSDVQLQATVDLETEMAASLRQWRVPADTIELEIPQSALMNAAEIDARLRKLRQAGLRVALSDFGSGYCSLSQLATARVQRLKLARTIVAGVAAEPTNAIVARTAIRLANELAIKVVAEGVETLAQANCLAALGCKQAQGFHFARPLIAAPTTELLRQGFIPSATSSSPKVATAA